MLHCVKAKALQKAEYSDFRIFAKFETRNINNIPNISKLLHENHFFIFAEILVPTQILIKNLITSLERRALAEAPI